MSGYNLILEIRRLESRLHKLGFVMCASKHSYSQTLGDTVAVRPKDNDALPIYSRDAELFVGTLEQLGEWIRGVEWSRDYDRMVFGKNHDKNRERKEQDWRNKELVKILKDSK